MLPRCLTKLLLLIYIQSTFAQLPNLLRNGGFQNLPAQDINQPVGSNLPVTSNIPLINTLLGGNAPVNGLQNMPKLKFITGQINELIKIANNINKGQIAGNYPLNYVQSAPINNELQMINNNGLPVNNMLPNNPSLPVNNLYSNGHNLQNNIPNNNYIPANNAPYSNLPCYDNQFNSNALQYKLPEKNNIGFSNLPINKLSKINSLTLAGEPFNNGMPFSVLPANVDLSNVNELPLNNFFNYKDGPNNGLKITRSLPANDLNESGFPVADSIIEKNCVSPWQSYTNEVQTGNLPQNNIMGNGFPLNNGMSLNNGVPMNNAVSLSTTDASTFSNVPAVLPFTNDYAAIMPISNREALNSFDINHFNNIQPNNEQIDSNNYRIPLYTEWQPTLNPIYNKNNALIMANLPASNEAYSQPTSNNFNLPDLANINMFKSSEIDNLQNNELLVANIPASNVAYSQTTGSHFNVPDLANINRLNVREVGNLENNELLVANLPASNVAYSQPSGNNFNLQELANINMLKSGEIGKLQNNELVVANLPVSNLAYSQPSGNNFNLPDLVNMNMLKSGEIGKLQNNELLVENLPASNVAYSQGTGNHFYLPDLANVNRLNVREVGNLQNNELLVENLPASNMAYSQLTGNNFNLPDLTNVNLLNFGELGNFPVFSGLPVLGITETVTVINPDQFKLI